MNKTQGAYTKTPPISEHMRHRSIQKEEMRSTDTIDKKGKVITDHLSHNLKNLQILLESPTFGVGESPEARAVVEMFEFTLRTLKEQELRIKKLEYPLLKVEKMQEIGKTMERRRHGRLEKPKSTDGSGEKKPASERGKADLSKV